MIARSSANASSRSRHISTVITRRSQAIRLGLLLSCLLRLGLLAEAAEPALPDSQASSAVQAPTRRRGLGRLTLSQHYMAPANFSDFGGDVGINTSSMRLNLAMISLGYTYHAFEWGSTARLPFSDGGDPWTHLQSWQLSARFRKKLTDRQNLRFRLGLSSAFEREMSSALSWNAATMLAWPAGEDWDFGLGLMVRGHEAADIDYPVLPAARISWRQRQTGWSAALGFPKTELRYAWNEKLSVALGAGYTIGNTFRLADSSPVVPGGYAKFRGFALEGSSRWQIQPKISLTWGVAWVGDQELELYDDDGDELRDYDLDRTWATRLGLNWRF